jgi:hypothetical protein
MRPGSFAKADQSLVGQWPSICVAEVAVPRRRACGRWVGRVDTQARVPAGEAMVVSWHLGVVGRELTVVRWHLGAVRREAMVVSWRLGVVRRELTVVRCHLGVVRREATVASWRPGVVRRE